MSITSDLNTILAREQELASANGRLIPFSYTSQAYDDDDYEGVEEFDYGEEQNIPLGTRSVVNINEEVETKGFRAQGSSLPRMLVDHFFGRTSYNLNKAHDHLVALIDTIKSIYSELTSLANRVTTNESNIEEINRSITTINEYLPRYNEHYYVVASDGNLLYWLTNGSAGTRGKGHASANDFYSVLVKRGTYNVTLTSNSTNDIFPIDFRTLKTKRITGEEGAEIHLNLVVDKVITTTTYDLFTKSTSGYDFYIEGIKFVITVEVKQAPNVSSEDPVLLSVFDNIVNVKNCSFRLSGRGSYTESVLLSLFRKSSNIDGVHVTISKFKDTDSTTKTFLNYSVFYESKRISNTTVEADNDSAEVPTLASNFSLVCIAFGGCKDITDCDISLNYATYIGEKTTTATAFIVGISNSSNVNGCNVEIRHSLKATVLIPATAECFNGCFALARNTAKVPASVSGATNNPFNNCFASHTEVSTYSVADTEAGGFNYGLTAN